MFRFHDNQTLAISPCGGSFTGADLHTAAGTLASVTESRSLVFALCTNTVGSLGGYLSFLQNKVVPVMLDAAMDRDLLQQLVDTYRPDSVWSPAAQAAEGLFRDWTVKTEIYGYCLLENPQPLSKRQELHPELALLLTTSGSTGSPKLVRLTYGNLLSNAESIANYLDITAIERPITSLPMHYSYGLSVINSHLLRGATILLTPRSIMEAEFWAFFREQGATSIAGVPYTYQMLKRLRLQRMELPTLKTLTQAGGKLGAELVREFAEWAEDTGRHFIVMYGQTEATARMSYLPWPRELDKSGSIGIAIPEGAFALIDTEGEEITVPDTPGELIYRGPNVSMGYAETAEDLSKGDENGGVLRTGDVAQFDADGYLYIVGRLKRFIKIFGNRVNLDQAEQIAKALTPDCACTGVDDKLTVHVIDASLSDAMRAHMAGKLGLHPSAIRINIVFGIPKNSSGKVQYAALEI